MATAPETAVLLDLFEYLFGRTQGYVCIATTRPPARRDTFQERYWEWPKQANQLVEFIDEVRHTHNVYFCVNLLSVAKRKQENVLPLNLVWADLDTCNPNVLDIPPQCVIQSSHQRYQAVWRLDESVDPRIAENYSKRIAYHYAGYGVDKSGWDIGQLLRVPGTFNFKYPGDEPPEVRLITMIEDLLPVGVFTTLPQPDPYEDVPDLAVPDVRELDTAEMIITRYRSKLEPTEFARYYGVEPANDWSKYLWRLINLCFDIGMTTEETFVIAHNSKCNKYERDGRPVSHLWKEVLKAQIQHTEIEVILQSNKKLEMPQLLSGREESDLQPTVIDDYFAWATSITDAVPDFHEIICAMVMSALMSTTLRLHTSNAVVYPNLWALILGESSTTRKSTAMEMGMQYIMDIDQDLILTTDASGEGLLTGLSNRPKMVSIFYRDEVTGFFDAINRKDYLAAMPEIMTKMYDVPKYMPRTLRKETFVVSEPIFIFFGGGVPEKMYSLIHEEYISSGFIPRFMILRGYPDWDNMRATGPPVVVSQEKRNDLLSTFRAFHSMYTDNKVTMTLHDNQTISTTAEIQVMFTDEMWARAAEVEVLLRQTIREAPDQNKAAPQLTRMFTSMLKLTMLLAAARQEPKDLKVYAEMRDLMSAMHYIQKWGKHAIDLILHSGTSQDENKIRMVYSWIERNPGVMRGEVMRRYHLNARTMDIIEDTLIQRDEIRMKKIGQKSKQYWPIG